MTDQEIIELLREAITAAQQDYYKESNRAKASKDALSGLLEANLRPHKASDYMDALENEKKAMATAERCYKILSEAEKLLEKGWRSYPQRNQFIEPIIKGIDLLRVQIDAERVRWGGPPINHSEFDIDKVITRYEDYGRGEKDYHDVVRFQSLHQLKDWLRGGPVPLKATVETERGVDDQFLQAVQAGSITNKILENKMKEVREKTGAKTRRGVLRTIVEEYEASFEESWPGKNHISRLESQCKRAGIL